MKLDVIFHYEVNEMTGEMTFLGKDEITVDTSITKKQGDLGVGNIIGANIIDLVLILPICSFISNGQLIIEPQSMFLDIPASLVISLVAVLPTLIFKKFTKVQGFALLVLYILYIILAATIKF